MSRTYHQEMVLAMELDGRHVGKLVQIITESWSMTGTLTRVDQHDNREWSITAGGHLTPLSGEIYTDLFIGPWEGRVIGNQPVTVETVKGTLEAPERAALPGTRRSPLITEEEMESARATIMGEVIKPDVPLERASVERCPRCGIPLTAHPAECWI